MNTADIPSGVERVNALCGAWLTLQDVALKTPPSSKTDSEAVISSIKTDHGEVELHTGIPYWPMNRNMTIINGPPSKIGTVWMAKADLGFMRKVPLYCPAQVW